MEINTNSWHIRLRIDDFTLGIQIVSFAIEYSYLENIYQKEEYQIVEGVVENYANN